MKELKIKFKTLIVLGVIFSFVLGMYAGSMLQQRTFTKSLTTIAEGLEGNSFELNIDLNETILIEGMARIFNITEEENEDGN